MDLILPAMRGYAALNLRTFSRNWGNYLARERKQPTHKYVKEARERRDKARWLRPFMPQSTAKIERVDTNADNKAKGRIYLTMSNGQVLRADKMLYRGTNPILREKIVAYVDAQEKAA